MIRKSNDPEHLDAFTDADWSGDSIDRESPSGGTLKFGSRTLREFTKGQSCQTLSSGESECYAAMTTTEEALHLQRLLEFLGMPVKLRLRIDSTAARGIIQRQGCGPLKHIETRPLWPQAEHEERKLTVIKEPTQTNTADGFTKALQTAKYLEWRSLLSMGYDHGDDGGTSKREALAETVGTSRSAARSPALSVDRNPDAARVHDETTSLERLDLVEQGLSKLRAQPWRTVAV